MRRLYTRIYVHFVALLVLCGLVGPLLLATNWRGAFLRNFTERLARHAASLVAARGRDVGDRTRFIRQLADELDIELTFRAPDGHPEVVVGDELPALDAATRDEIARGPLLSGRGKRFYVAAPVRDRDDGQLLGFLQAAPVRHVRATARLLIRPALALAAGLLLIAFGVAPLARRLSRPIDRLTEASRRLAGGDLSARVAAPRHRRRHGRPDELEELIRAWNEMAARVEQMVHGQRELLANVSHELRSPLQRMKLALELLPEAARSDEESARRLADLDLDLGELERLIDDVLTTSRLEATGLPARLETVAVRPLLEGLVERAHGDPLTRAVAIAVGAVEVETVEADPALLRRALWNLIENAAKYGQAPITLSARTDGEGAALAVSDEGAGIPPAERTRVTEPFYRQDRARTASAEGRGGFGLGLTLARRVAEVHGGRVTIDDLHPGQTPPGCVVTLHVGAPRRA